MDTYNSPETTNAQTDNDKNKKNSKLKKCKVCGAEIAKNAKTCPHCGAKLKKGHPVLIGVLALVFIVVIIAAFADDDEPKKVENSDLTAEETETTQHQTEQKEDKNVFYVGETAELKDVEVTFVGVTENYGSTYNTPSDGNVFVLCEFDIANNSDKEISVSSMLSFDAYCDSYTCTFSLGALMAKGNKNQLDGTVAAGKKFNGVVGYEVPENWQELEISFTPDFWGGKDITFIADNA